MQKDQDRHNARNAANREKVRAQWKQWAELNKEEKLKKTNEPTAGFLPQMVLIDIERFKKRGVNKIR